MRISIEPGDRAHDPQQARKVLSVHVDGVLYPYVLTADSDEGFVRCLAAGEDGQPIRDGDRYRTLEVRGQVVIALSSTETYWDKTRRPDGAHSKVAVGRLDGSLVVDVYSAVRPGAIRRMTLDRAEEPGNAVMAAQRVGLLAGAAAENLCGRFGDTIDPSEVARVAVQQATLLLADEARG